MFLLDWRAAVERRYRPTTPGRAARPVGGAEREPAVPGWMPPRTRRDGPSAPPTAARLDPIEANSADIRSNGKNYAEHASSSR
ncbi:hypothetical protein SAMN05216266_107300 [Amycolatopsis marina]|uniref:Uncharacterized protein n=1 Tax=Amycolatopsis marina TaxID=490629 RepID=A0A1I0ZXR5_9PSEU|nr:hypothetical protein SAMN05216266_107300 [Amycolatopsis marina]